MTCSRIPFTVLSCGRVLVGIYHRPETISLEVPLVICCHGLGGHKSGTGRVLVALSEALSAKGIASVRFDFVGSGDSEGQLFELTPSVCVENIVDVVRVSRSSGFLPDSCRFGPVGLFGRSFGGYVCLRAACQIEGMASIAVHASPFDVDSFSVLPAYLQEREGQLFFSGERMSRKFLEEMQGLPEAMEQLTKIPLLHVASENDQVISRDHVQKFQEIRRNAEALTKFHCIAGADHSCSFFPHRVALVQEVSRWFEETLLMKNSCFTK